MIAHARTNQESMQSEFKTIIYFDQLRQCILVFLLSIRDRQFEKKKKRKGRRKCEKKREFFYFNFQNFAAFFFLDLGQKWASGRWFLRNLQFLLPTQLSSFTNIFHLLWITLHFTFIKISFLPNSDNSFKRYISSRYSFLGEAEASFVCFEAEAETFL